jgi:hypothetical protein
MRQTDLARLVAELRKQVVISPGEEQEFEQLLGEHLAQYEPLGVIEQTLFTEMVVSAWNLRRIRRVEATLQKAVDPHTGLDDKELQKKLDRLNRHLLRIEASYYRALKALKRQQAERRKHKSTKVSSLRLIQ